MVKIDSDRSPQMGVGVGAFSRVWWEGMFTQALHGLLQRSNRFFLTSLKSFLREFPNR